MKIRLGYACLSVTIDATSSKTLTYTSFQKLKEKGYDKLDQVILSNFQNLEEILKYNIANDIYFYRLSSSIIPLISHPNVNIDLNKYRKNFEKIGNIINENNMRVDIHMSPYYVLNSVNEQVVKTTINICKIYQNMFKLMKIKSNLIFHIGGKTISKEEGINRFVKNFERLDDEVKKIILIENDDKIYTVKDCISIVKRINVNVCLDYHHYKCNNEKENLKECLDYVIKKFSGVLKMHFSSPKNKKELRSHNDYIDVKEFILFLNIIKDYNRDIDIMIEAKMKDEALFRLVRQLKYCGYKVVGTTIYL